MKYTLSLLILAIGLGLTAQNVSFEFSGNYDHEPLVGKITDSIKKEIETFNRSNSVIISDSLVFTATVLANGSIGNIKNTYGHVSKLIEHGKLLLSDLKLEKPATKNDSVAVCNVQVHLNYSSAEPISYGIFEFDTYPDNRICGYSKTDNLYNAACYNYSFKVHHIDKIPYPTKLVENGHFGKVNLDFIIDTLGRVSHVIFKPVSTQDLELNDYILDYISKIRINGSLKHNDALAPIKISYQKSFSFMVQTDSEVYYQKFNQLLKTKKYVDAIFYFDALEALEYKFNYEDYKKVGLAHYRLSHTSLAIYLWQQSFSHSEEWDKRELLYKVDENDNVELSYITKKEDPDLQANLISERKPRWTTCDKNESEEEQYYCFQRSIMKHISKNFNYPERARQLGIMGKVYVSFVITEEGNITDINIVKSVDKTLDLETIRLICTFPNIEPAILDGKAVKMSYTLPINFKLQ